MTYEFLSTQQIGKQMRVWIKIYANKYYNVLNPSRYPATFFYL